MYMYYVYRVFGAFTLEAIFASAFGRVIDIQKGQSNKLTEAAAAIFDESTEQGNNSPYFFRVILSNLEVSLK